MKHKKIVSDSAIFVVGCCVDGNFGVRTQPNSLAMTLKGMCYWSSCTRCAKLVPPNLFHAKKGSGLGRWKKSCIF